MQDILQVNFAEYFQPYEKEIFRTVEGQDFIVTRKLVDSNEEQERLEEILDKSKPPFPVMNSRGKLHYLLYTPFRYPPLKSGGRFHTRLEQSLFYGSEELITSFTEVAYHRFLFNHHTMAKFEPMQVPYTNFVVKIKSTKAILLNAEPFVRKRKLISHPSSYQYSQTVGLAMRNSGADMFSYFSARAKHGVNVGVLSPEAFQSNQPLPGKEKNWIVYVGAKVIEFQRAHRIDKKKEVYIFKIEDFYFGQKFPIIGLHT